MRLLLILVACALVGGCSNRVRSETPWFTSADAVGAAPLRPGLWIAEKDGKCRFDQRKPLEQWPQCAAGFVVRADDTVTLQVSTEEDRGRTKTSYDWASEPLVLAAGEPRIRVDRDCATMRKKSDATAASDAAVTLDSSATAAGSAAVADAGSSSANDSASSASEPNDPTENLKFCYSAVQPTATDAGGRIIAFESWSIFCGPWPRTDKHKNGDEPGPVTDAPFPGLHVIADSCTAESVAALRAAAKPSRAVWNAVMVQPAVAHWVRDGYR